MNYMDQYKFWLEDSYFDEGDLFPHVTYFFPFEYT